MENDTAQADSAVRSRMRDLGAVDCLLKPFSEAALLEALNAALLGGLWGFASARITAWPNSW
jgi:CheY-like chemotaxis protein